MNVYIVGRVNASYRTQNLVKWLLDQGHDIHLSTQTVKFLKGKSGVLLLFRYIIRLIHEIIFRFLKVYQILISELVVIPACCNEYQFELKTAKFFNKKILCDFYISYFDTWVLDRNKFDATSKYAKKLLRWDKSCIINSDKVIFLNIIEAMRYLDLINEPFDKSKHLVIPLISEAKKQRKIDYYRDEIKGHKVYNICWWGSYIPLHGIDKIIEVARLLSESSVNCHFYLFGNSENESMPYRRIISDLNLIDHITIRNDLTFKNRLLEEFLVNHCDLALGNFGDSEKAINVITNKLLEAVNMKLPVITCRSNAVLEYFGDDSIIYSENTPDSIAEKIKEIMLYSGEKVQYMTNKAYKIYEENFSIDAYRNSMADLFSHL